MNKRSRNVVLRWAMLIIALVVSLAWYRANSSQAASLPSHGTTPAVSYASVAGVWTSVSCEPLVDATGKTIGYDKRSFTLASGIVRTWSLDFAVFADATCQSKSFVVHILGTYSIGDRSTKVRGARNAFFGFSQKSLVASTQDIATLLTNLKCGTGQWQVGVEQNISQAGCPALGVVSIPSCIQEYDLLKLDRERGRLFFGKRPTAGDMCAPQRRPTAVGLPLVRSGS